MTALLFFLQLNQLPSLYNPVNPPFGIGRMPERGLLISPPGEGALHSQSGAVSRGLQAEDIRLPGVAGCYSFFCVVSSGTYVGKSRKSDAPGDTSSAVRRSAQEPTEATSQNQPGSVGILSVQREEDVNRRFSGRRQRRIVRTLWPHFFVVSWSKAPNLLGTRGFRSNCHFGGRRQHQS